jgi:hypothetical protein
VHENAPAPHCVETTCHVELPVAHLQAAPVALPAGTHNKQGHWGGRVVGMAQPHSCQWYRPTHWCSSELDGLTHVLHGDYAVATSGCCDCWRHLHMWMLLRPTIRCAPKSPDNVHVTMKATRSIGHDDDNNEAWDPEPVSSGTDIGLHPGGLNGRRDVRHPTLGQFLVYYDMDSVPPQNPCAIFSSTGVRRVRSRPLSNGGVGRTLPVSLILSSSLWNTLKSGWRRAGYLSA